MTLSDTITTLLRAASAPAVVVAQPAPLDAARRLVDLGFAWRAKVLPWGHDPLTARARVRWDAGEAFDADLQIAATGELATLDAVLALRQAWRDDPQSHEATRRIAGAKRVWVQLDGDTDPRVVCQWHLLADEVRQCCAMVVSSQRDMTADVLAWRTGLTGPGVDLGHEPATVCPGWRRLTEGRAIDTAVIWGDGDVVVPQDLAVLPIKADDDASLAAMVAWLEAQP